MCSKRRDRVFVVALWALFALGLVGAGVTAGGCTPADQGGADAKPAVQFSGASVSGELELADGTVVDLSTGLTVGDTGQTQVRRLDLDVSATISVNDLPQTVELQSRNHRDESWIRCLSGGLDVMGYTARGRFPLAAECGEAGLTELVYRPPFRAAPSESGGD